MISAKGIIFDYGGTIDTNGVHWGEVIWAQYQRAETNISKELFREAYVHGERTLAKSPIIEPCDTFHTLLKKKINIQFEYIAEQDTPLPAPMADTIANGCYAKVIETIGTTVAVVKKLAQEYPLVLVTNFYGNMPVVLEEFGLNGLFKQIVESSVVGVRKPNPALFALGVEALQLQPQEVVVVGDSYGKDIYPASTLGCHTVWLKNICWSEEPVIPGHEATAMLSTLEQLPQAIQSILQKT